MKAIKHEGNSIDGFSIQIGTDKGFNVWVDVDVYKGDVRVDWNQYIFHLDNKEEAMRMEFQDNADNFMECSSLALSYLEDKGLLKQDHNGVYYFV
jgi:hypothetical protein